VFRATCLAARPSVPASTPWARAVPARCGRGPVDGRGDWDIGRSSVRKAAGPRPRWRPSRGAPCGAAVSDVLGGQPARPLGLRSLKRRSRTGRGLGSSARGPSVERHLAAPSRALAHLRAGGNCWPDDAVLALPTSLEGNPPMWARRCLVRGLTISLVPRSRKRLRWRPRERRRPAGAAGPVPAWSRPAVAWRRSARWFFVAEESPGHPDRAGRACGGSAARMLPRTRPPLCAAGGGAGTVARTVLFRRFTQDSLHQRYLAEGHAAPPRDLLAGCALPGGGGRGYPAPARPSRATAFYRGGRACWAPDLVGSNRGGNG